MNITIHVVVKTTEGQFSTSFLSAFIQSYDLH